ncbi:MAG: type VI secretion system contractile sheath small subunit [Planctomycetota bacterium]
MSNISIQRVLQKVRPPRVRISYDVQVGNATEKKELPFVVGVMGDFSGDPTQPLKSLADRKFIEISRDNFDTVMTRMTPGLNLRVKNTLEDDGTEMAVQLKFQSMKDFEPARIVDQIKPLKELMEARRKLMELKTKVDLVPNLENHLQELLSDPDKLKKAAGDTVTAGNETKN